MRLGPSTHLTYCLNVHPGEDWASQMRAIRECVPTIRNAVCPSAPFGLGLRLSNLASNELADPAVRRAFADLLRSQNLYVYTVNAFPYGSFHGSPVKEAVYRPDWRDPERAAYTCRVADILADWLPEGLDGSISTVPGSYGAWILTDEDRLLMVDHLADVAAHLHRIRERTGREIHLGLEPEPDCFLQDTPGVLRFFDENLRPHATRRLTGRHGHSGAEAERILARHIGICFDTCHIALQFEDLARSLTRIRSAGIRISKVQVSAALQADESPAGRAALAAFCEPVYLHQVTVRSPAGIRSIRDLDEALRNAPGGPGQEWRVHCHIPLDYQGDGPLQSTAGTLTPEFWKLALADVSHFEIETYTFLVLPESIRARGLAASIIGEYQWLLPRLASASLG